MEKMEVSCDDTIETIPEPDQNDEVVLKGNTSRLYRLLLAISLLAVVLIIGCAVGVYLTTDEEIKWPTYHRVYGENPRIKNFRCGVPSPPREDINYTGLDGNSSYNPRMKSTIPSRGTRYGCGDVKTNRFLSKELAECIYVFTESPSKEFISDNCGFNVLSIEEITPICDTILKDFETCCLQYFKMQDPEWWAFISGGDPEVRKLTSRRLTDGKQCNPRPAATSLTWRLVWGYTVCSVRVPLFP